MNTEAQYGWGYEMSDRTISAALRQDIRRRCRKLGISVRDMKLNLMHGELVLPDPLNPWRVTGKFTRLYVIQKRYFEGRP